MRPLYYFLAVAFSTTAVASIGPLPKDKFPHLEAEVAAYRMYRIISRLQMCFCNKRDVDMARMLIFADQKSARMRIHYIDNAVARASPSYQDVIQGTPRYHQVLNRLLRLCAFQFLDDVRETLAGNVVDARLREESRLPPSLQPVGNVDFKELNEALMRCVCAFTVVPEQVTLQPDGLVDLYEQFYRCINDFFAHLPNDPLNIASSATTMPNQLPSPSTPPPLRRNRETAKQVAIQPVSPPSRKLVGSASEEIRLDADGLMPILREMTRRAGDGIKGATANVRTVVNKPKIKAWTGCMGGCMDLATVADIMGSFKTCTPQCPDLGIPHLTIDTLLRTADRVRQENLERFQQLLENHSREVVVVIFLAAVLFYLLGPVALSVLAI